MPLLPWKSKLIFILAFVLAALLSTAHHAPPALGEVTFTAQDLFVALDGNDDNTGSYDAPLATIHEAKERLKALSDTESKLTVWIRGGTYLLESMLVFTQADRNNVTYTAYPGETVIISGGEPITFQNTEILNNHAVWVAPIPEAARGFNALYGAEGILSASRYPKEGYFTVSAVSEDGIAYKETDTKTHYYSFYVNTATFRDNLRSFANPGDILIRILHLWKDELATLRSFEPSDGKITLSRPTSLTIAPGDRFYFEQVKEALTEPGEWYYDHNMGLIYYYPYPGQQLEDTILYAGRLSQLMIVDNMANVTFQDLTFMHTNWVIPNGNTSTDFAQAAYDVDSSILVQNSKSLVFNGCTFKSIGGTALRLGLGVTETLITECLFQDIGANAIFIHGVNAQDNALSSSRIAINNNHICRYGLNFFNAVGILLVHADACSIINNEIHDGYYSGISAGWVWGYGYNVTSNLLIADNLIYDIGQEMLSDMGGIYLLGVQKGTIVSGNVVHDVIATQTTDGGYGGWGIYLDEGASYITIKNNLVYHCGSQGLHQNYGRDNVIENNIIAYNLHGQIAISAKEPHTSMTLRRNIICGSAIHQFADSPTGATKDESNLYWDEETSGILAVALQATEHFRTAVIADPGFVDPQNGDFNMDSNTASELIGFVPWDYSQAGTLKEFDVH